MWSSQQISLLICASCTRRTNETRIRQHLQNLAALIANSGHSLQSSSVVHLCSSSGHAVCRNTTNDNRDFCLRRFWQAHIATAQSLCVGHVCHVYCGSQELKRAFDTLYLIKPIVSWCRSEAAINEACKAELEALQQWLAHREAQAAQQSITCWSQVPSPVSPASASVLVQSSGSMRETESSEQPCAAQPTLDTGGFFQYELAGIVASWADDMRARHLRRKDCWACEAKYSHAYVLAK